MRYYFGKTDTGKKNASDYLSFGFNFSVPLPLTEEKTESVQEAEIKYFEAAYDKQVNDTIHDVINAYYEYVFKIDDLIKFLYQKQILLEQVRKQLVKLDMKDEKFSVPELVSLSIQYINTEFEILHIKQLLYLNLAFIVKYIPEASISQFVSPVNIEKDVEIYAKQRTGERAVYVWSHTFNKIDNGFMHWFLKTKIIRTLLISFGKDTDREKLKNFLDLAGNFFQIEALIGNNELLNQQDKLISLMSEFNNYKFSGIHLDIEPYTFPDWQKNREQYLQKYFELLQTLKGHPYMKNRTLTVSVPIFYTEDFLKKIFPVVDRVYVMAYGTKNPDTIARWIKKAFEIDRSKVVIALRCKDFENQIEFENFITEINERTDVSSFAIHSLKEYMEIGGNYETQIKTELH
ncbi:MAG: glycoside hydrolase family 18 protein [Candidatus Omnitrophica bacterium]|nr:glycoside hydrolase family 18 protein [Candidatus Omnitrophota bacterium]